MAIEPVPSIVALYSPVPDRQTQQGNELSNNMDGFSFSIGPWGDSIKLIGDNVENNATEAENFATASSGYAADSATSASSSLTYRNQTQTLYNDTVAVVANIDEGTMSTGDDFDDIDETWNKARIALETNSAPYKPVIDLDFARDTFKSYVGLAAGWQTAPLLDLATFTRVGDAAGVNAFGLLETVGTDQPRVVFENGVAKGILLESGGSNLFTYSEDFSNVAWSKIDITVGSNVATAPNGELTADRLTKTAASFKFIKQTLGASTAGVYNTFFHVKSDTLSSASILLTGDAGSTLHGRVVFNLATGTATSESSTDLIDAYIEDAPYGFKKIVVIADLAVATNVQAYLYPDNYTASAAGSIFAWGGQLSEGYPSSYIKTTTDPVSRNADIFRMDIPNFNKNSFSVFIDASFYDTINTDRNYLLFITDSELFTGTQWFGLAVLNSTLSLRSADGSTIASIVMPNVGGLNKLKSGVTYSDGAFSWFVNGSKIGDYAVSDDFDYTRYLKLNSVYSEAEIDGTVSRLQLYNTAIPDVLMQSWTGV